MKSIEIICPLYNAENYIEKLNESIKKQIGNFSIKTTYILTRGKDFTEEKLKKINANYIVIDKAEFSHSLTREQAALKSDSDVLVFITQDVDIKNNDWLINLVQPIIDEKAEACFSRQLTKYNNIEKYTREKNYPDKSYIVTEKDINTLGLRTFFFSDASSAIKTCIFKKLNGYDSKKLIISEDMYIAYKIITNGYRIRYCAESIVYHSHDFSLKELYKRYYDTGVFFKENSYLDEFKTNKTGGDLAIYILKRAIQEKNINVLFKFIPNMLVRFIGMKVGKINGK